MHHYDLGAAFYAATKDPERPFSIRVDDVTSVEPPIGPSLYWINPPLSTGSLRKFQRRAAKTTEGVRQVSLKEIYQAVAKMVHSHPDNGFVWMMPELDGLDKLLESLGLGGVPSSPGSYRGKKIRLLADEVPARPLVHAEWTGSGADDFRQVFGPNPDLSMFKMIVDPCAGYSPLASVAIEHGLGYFGVEINSFEAFRGLRHLRPKLTEIKEPVARTKPASGVVIGADDGPTHKPVDELRDFKQGRTFVEMAEIHRRSKDR